MADGGAECVKVVVRLRPLNKTEKANNNVRIVDINTKINQVVLKNPKGADDKKFTFDMAYNFDSKQRGVYDDTAYPLVESVMEGFNGTIFACTILSLNPVLI